MGDITTVTDKLKEGSSSSIRYPMLTTTNYTVWALKMKIVLQLHKVWEAVETEKKKGEQNIMATALLFQAIPEALVLQIGSLGSAKKIWDAVKVRHVGADRVREARLCTLRTELTDLE